ncbi:hypothetical protein PG991_008734 [Apiospora marii]|uniref:Fungal STAND N-terminal Goodbye domain-containing protein n=1 Tax=Apiospora marii TaxID=335849 RepID=A0ABR1RMN5_9PEZI
MAAGNANNANTILSPTGPEAQRAATQKDIDAIWAQLELRVKQLAKRQQGDEKLKKLNIDDVLGYVDSIQQSEKDKEAKFGWFKKAVGNTLKCIQTVGGIVSSGVSEVFGPADMCFNALTFVIAAWQGYEGMFENLGELLERCSHFLERLAYYDGTMDIRLTRLACQNLQLFVEICDHSIRLTKKRNKFGAFMKRLFLNDDNISGLLGMMDKLNSNENLLVGAQTYKIVSDSAGDIKLILENQKEQKKEDDVKKWRKSIAKVLGFPNSALGSDGEPYPTWQRTFDARKDKLIEGTGTWILKQPDFVEWTKPGQSTNPFLVIEGSQNSGKTSLIANALRLFRQGERGSTSSRTVTAFFFADADKRKPQEDDTDELLDIITRTILWQVATAFEAMTKSMAQIAERSPDSFNTIDRWQQLFINNKERINNDTSFFFFIDAGRSDVEILLPLLEKLGSISDGKRVQVMLSATPQTTSDTLREKLGTNIGIVPISQCNAGDVDLYIKKRMDEMPILRDETRAGISEWRKRIFETLRDKCEGDYFKLDSNLKDLEKVDLVDDIYDVLENAGKSKAAQIDSALRSLNNIRTPKEIDEINEIILWVNDGRRWLSVDALESIVAIKHRRSAARLHANARPAPLTHGSRRKTGQEDVAEKVVAVEEKPATTTLSSNLTVSLLPFERKLTDKYDPLFTITDSKKVNWRSEEVKQRIPHKTGYIASLVTGHSGPAAEGRPQVVQETEIDIVKHFLKNVCPQDLYTRFDFEQFFNGKLGAGQKQYICLDPENAHIRIVITCLLILTDEGYKNDRQLRDYASFWLLDHLIAVDLSAAERGLKVQVGPLLVKLLTEECGIDALFWPNFVSVSFKTWCEDEGANLQEARGEWVYSTEGVEQVALWLKDSMVVQDVRDEVGEAFIKAVKDPKINPHKAVLGRAAQEMARHMFCRAGFTKQQFLSAACFIRGYLDRLDKKKAKRMYDKSEPYIGTKRGLNQYEKPTFTIEELKQIEDWAFSVLDGAKATPEQESQWEIHCALAAFQLCRDDKGEPAKGAREVFQSRAKKALDLDPRNWHACHFYSIQSKMGNEEAIELLSKAKCEIDEKRRKEANWDENSANPALLARITLELGNRQWSLGTDLRSAAETHRESLGINYVHYREYVPLLERYLEKREWHEFIAFVEAINTNLGNNKKWAAYLEDLVHEFLGSHKVQESQILARAANATERWDVVETLFDSAIQLAVGKKRHDLLFYLRNGFAKTLSAAADDSYSAQAVTVQKQALEGLHEHPSEQVSPYAVEDMKNSLAQGYLEIAFAPGVPAEKIQSYGPIIEKLVPASDEKADVWTSIDRTCCLIRFHHKQKSESKAADEWRRKIVRAGLELLSDGDFDNDDMAYWVLARLFATMGDEENSKIVWRLRNMFQFEAQKRWDNWLASQPSDIRSEAMKRNSATLSRTISEVAFEPIDASTNSSMLLDTQAPVSSLLSMVSEEPVPNMGEDDTASNGSSTQDSDAEPTSETAGSKASASSSSPSSSASSVLANAPMEPTSMVCCAGCGTPWTIVGVDMYECADCVGTQQLCQGCHDRLKQGELRDRVSLKCRPGHEHIKIPAWDPANSVPLPRKDAEGKTVWLSIDEWKAKLRELYLDGTGKVSEAAAA